MGSAGDGQEGLRDRQTGAGRGRTREIQKRDREKDKETKRERQKDICTDYPLVSIHFPGHFITWDHGLPHP